MPDFKEFNASTVPLSLSNLIEASAGTGKTYSIAILTLRLIIENEIPIKEILMVTFTKAAVAELEERIRLFIRQAYKASKSEKIADARIAGIVESAGLACGLEKVQALLHEAVLFLDETSVLTIHSFCQQTLNEFAFETGQLFGAELVQDTEPLLQEEINKFWRKHVTVIPVGLLRHLKLSGLSRASIISVVKEHLTGKRYFPHSTDLDYSCCEEEHLALLEELKAIEEEEAVLRQALLDHVIAEMDDITKRGNGNGYSKKSLVPLLNDPNKFLKFLWDKRDGAAYVRKVYGDLIERLEVCQEAVEKGRDKIQELIRKLNCLAINEAFKGIAAQKSAYNQMSYDDLIQNLHKALVGNDNPTLIACLQTKYKAVFIDEFQDTDRMQYEIFQKAYGENTVLFYIGDPKQSIYAWRKADIFTYFKAQEEVDNLYGMNSNFRSSEAFIEAMNLFFKPQLDFDTFHFQQDEHAIEYIHVESPIPNAKGDLLYDDQVEVPMSIIKSVNKNELCNALTAQVVDLLSGAYSIIKGKISMAVRPADIGILVRSNNQGALVKRNLSRFGIPAVTIGDAKVLKSNESRHLLYILEAMIEISIASINKALLSPFTGYTDVMVRDLDEEPAIELFRKYKAVWEKDGIYAALNAFVTDYSVKQVLLFQNSETGERVLTNLFQLIELLHKVQTTKNLSPLELLGWLKRGLEGMENPGDEYEQRIESDEESVKIVTIHKSKGLEYNIVLAPFLDFTTTNKFTHCSYRDNEHGEYVSMEKNSLTEEQKIEYEKQLEQENRRLIYVAMTRAVYKCFLFKNTYYKSSTLSTFLNALHHAPSQLIRFVDEVPAIADAYFYEAAAKPPTLRRTSPVYFELAQPRWSKMSYSMLRRRHEVTAKKRAEVQQDPYDNFIFSQLTKGANTGNMLHNIFENIAFDHTGKWEYAVRNAVQRFSPLQAERYMPMLKIMLDQVLNAHINTGAGAFKLSEVDTTRSIHELEFDFTVSPFQATALNRFAAENRNIEVNDFRELEGVMNGKIDLFFEHQGMYYVLDWKSNYLGDTQEDYSKESLNTAMNENNYHLQYLLYTLATKKYLESRLPSFDYDSQFGGVIYLFVRGLRKNMAHGVFTNRPERTLIEQLDQLLSNPVLVGQI